MLVIRFVGSSSSVTESLTFDVKTVEAASYRLEDLKSGIVKVC
jgi:hypothetical protein